jgi:hypothetical protein
MHLGKQHGWSSLLKLDWRRMPGTRRCCSVYLATIASPLVIWALLLALAGSPPSAWASMSADWGKGAEVTPPADAAPAPEVSLGEVTCPSVGNCTAIGSYIDTSGDRQGLLLSATSGTWGTGVEVTPPAGAAANPQIGFAALSCPSAGNCTVIGRYIDNSGHLQHFALSETSGTWGTAVEVALPANTASAPEVAFSALSCPSAGNCTAVGKYTESSEHEQGLILSEHSGTWDTAVEATMPANVSSGPGVSMRGLSCPSAGNCTAVGEYNDSAGNNEGFLLTETSGTWDAAAEAPPPANAEPQPTVLVNGVSCPSVGNCLLVGEYFDTSDNLQGLLMSETSGVWHRGIAAPLPANGVSEPNVFRTYVFLNGVQCSSAGNCTVVGQYIDNSNQTEGVLLTETAGAWGTGVEAPLPPNARSEPFFEFSSLSCSSPGDCAASAHYSDSSNNRDSLLLTESAQTWGPTLEAQPPTNAGPSPETYLTSVSCSLPDNCTAVGDYVEREGHQQGLILTATPTTADLSVSGPLGGAFAGSPIPASSISAALAGGSAPTGTITFTVFGPQASPPSSCTSGGTTVGTASASGDWTYQPSTGFTPPSPGDYWWYARYGGDVGDEPSTSTCGPDMAETSVLSKVTPTLSTSGPLGGVVGSPITASSISAALAGGSAPTGTITFTVFGPQASPPSSCTSGGTTVGTASVNGSGMYQPSGALTPVAPGEYWWFASYNGDAGDEPATSACGALMAQTLVAAAQTPGSGTGSDPGIGSSSPGSGTSAKMPPPTLSRVKLGSKRSTGKKDIALTLTLSQPATIKVLIAENVKAHKHGGVCNPGAKKGKRCTATVEKRALTFSASAGPSALELKLAGLGTGSYTATVIAETANHKSNAVTLTFAITQT